MAFKPSCILKSCTWTVIFHWSGHFLFETTSHAERTMAGQWFQTPGAPAIRWALWQAASSLSDIGAWCYTEWTRGDANRIGQVWTGPNLQSILFLCCFMVRMYLNPSSIYPESSISYFFSMLAACMCIPIHGAAKTRLTFHGYPRYKVWIIHDYTWLYMYIVYTYNYNWWELTVSHGPSHG